MPVYTFRTDFQTAGAVDGSGSHLWASGLIENSGDQRTDRGLEMAVCVWKISGRTASSIPRVLILESDRVPNKYCSGRPRPTCSARSFGCLLPEPKGTLMSMNMGQPSRHNCLLIEKPARALLESGRLAEWERGPAWTCLSAPRPEGCGV
ncbi:unnamed protein product [Protopolystoma xenopodis]|uniref:Uncharacterized protein n=1 Tax=Protopolystoma xenopodis TaxID=117903 RepID=A0A448XG40_9PLAT|nr:unnamed protein product [Protopolystoma xenopodis]